MRQMTDLQMAQWAKTRAAGKKRFIWLQGVLAWGVPTAIICSVIQLWLGLGNHSYLRELTTSLITYPLGGYFFGWWTWALAERKYTKSLASANATQAA